MGRSLFQEQLHLSQVHAGECRGVPPGKARLESKPGGVEICGGEDITHPQDRVQPVAFDVEGSGRGHGFLASLTIAVNRSAVHH
jgi:hypothetical protein